MPPVPKFLCLNIDSDHEKSEKKTEKFGELVSLLLNMKRPASDFAFLVPFDIVSQIQDLARLMITLHSVSDIRSPALAQCGVEGADQEGRPAQPGAGAGQAAAHL